ncbi:hypothetical protein BH23PLA1_BH23PLA1_05790 [soil metagenome]
MAEGIPVLWSDDIKLDTLPPLAILRAQANALRQMTRGLLEAEVTTSKREKGRVEHRFDLIAPGLDGYRHRLFIVSHRAEMVYPVKVETTLHERTAVRRTPREHTIHEKLAEKRPTKRLPGAEETDLWTPNAATEQEFVEVVRQILQSNEVRSLIQSLVARSNEQRFKEVEDLPTEEGDEPSQAEQASPDETT